MQLEWLDTNLIDSEGDRQHVHYLVDAVTERCYATICEPQSGNILFRTDLKINREDHYYLNLPAAKAYCESAVQMYDLEQANESEKAIQPKEVPEPVPAI